MTGSLDEIAARVEGGLRLSDADARVLMASPDILAIGMLADDVRRRRHADRTTFVRVAEVPLESDDLEWPEAAGEIRITGVAGPLDAVCDRIARVVDKAVATPVSAFSLSDVQAMAAREGIPLPQALARLKEAGLELVAEAFLDEGGDLQEALRSLQGAGLRLARCTNRGSSGQAPIDLIRRAVALQDATGAVRSLAPLARHASVDRPSTGYEDVRVIAVARLLADNIESIQVDWALYGPKLAQVALTFGADDVDGVPAGEGAALGHRRRTAEEIRRNIRAASQTPVERNGRFEPMFS